jgi:hypothetical protein
MTVAAVPAEAAPAHTSVTMDIVCPLPARPAAREKSVVLMVVGVHVATVRQGSIAAQPGNASTIARPTVRGNNAEATAVVETADNAQRG